MVLLFTALALCILSVHGQFFANIISGDSPTLPVCSQVQISFGGGVPPYAFNVWSYYDQQYTSGTTTYSPGTAIWTIEYPPNSILFLFVSDATGFYFQSHYFQVLPAASGSTSCSTPEFQRADGGQSPFETGGQVPSNVPTPSATGIPAVAPTAMAAMNECSEGASCSFTPTSTGSSYPQQTLIGNAFDNCRSNLTVRQHFEGNVTITDNWSVEVGASIGLPKELGIDISGSVGHSETTTLSQSLDYEVPPQSKAALVGSATFDAIFGVLAVNSPSSGPMNIPDVVYFKRNTSVPNVVAVQQFGCNESWPIWNATELSDRNKGEKIASGLSPVLVTVAVLIMIVS
ncbi:hypothetical protein VKT23_008395 [Stygiomarasmius scandens]|uniref:Uncharacterized protein n=1 Tax=Marasmiellus scandens TaxID=2682957 RepID=A0ABR1JMC8_9AGAR